MVYNDQEFIGNKEGKLTGLKTVEVGGLPMRKEKRAIKKKNSEKIWDCDLVLLALGFMDQKIKSLLDLKLK